MTAPATTPDNKPKLELVTNAYDSRRDTQDHINRVRQLIAGFVVALLERGEMHDASKLGDPEKSLFDRIVPELGKLTFGTAEYAAALDRLRPALDHHYADNRHHPEHFPLTGVAGMNLLDLVEMVLDWKAASERQRQALDLAHLFQRFAIDHQLAAIIRNTALDLDWRTK